MRQETGLETNRRDALKSVPFLMILSGSNRQCMAATAPPSRNVDVGGGFDTLSEQKVPGDVIYPNSMEGTWLCERVIVKVEGDTFQAEAAFQSLGGKRKLEPGSIEQFQTRYIRSPLVDSTGVVADRGFEMISRTGGEDVQWEVAEPNALTHDQTRLRVVKRAVEVPNDQGFGFDELIRVDESLITRAVQVKRRYRRAFDEDGSRVIEGLEIMKTFRVLDGVAGTELPTSTTKSTIRMIRPSSS